MVRLFKGMGILPKLFRFGLVGGGSTTLFSILTWYFSKATYLTPVTAVVVAYLLLLPLNFLAHKYFTFNSTGATISESKKFALMHSLNLALSTAGMAVIARAGLDIRWGIGFSAIAVPIIVFVTMNCWVFRTPGA